MSEAECRRRRCPERGCQNRGFTKRRQGSAPESMAVVLKSKRGKTFETSDEHWSVFLNVAQRYGWQPAGTLPPPAWPRAEVWPGQYGTRDGQRVSDDDARAMALALYEAARGDGVARALRDVIGQVELAAERSGAAIRSNVAANVSSVSRTRAVANFAPNTARSSGPPAKWMMATSARPNSAA